MNVFLGPVRNSRSDMVIPPSGFTARLTAFSAAAMAFLAVFVLALSLAVDGLADRWSNELARTATVVISAAPGQLEQRTEAALNVLRTTPSIASVRVLGEAEKRALLEPWFGANLPLDALPIPQMIEVVRSEDVTDAIALQMRLHGEAPGAVYDDHTSWRRPLIAASQRLRLLGILAVLLITATTAAMIALAANSALAANNQVIRVLRLVGARDSFIVRAFVRRFTQRAFLGACAGTVGGIVAILAIPAGRARGGFLSGFGFEGWQWLWPLLIPILAGLVALIATRFAANRALKRLS